jgi:Peptidase family M28
MKLILPILIAINFFLYSQDLSKDKSLPATMNMPDKESIRSRIQFLSHDSLRGRKPGTPGFQMAVDFVIGQFKKLGVEPKGDDGYLQKVLLRTAKADTSKFLFEWNGTPLQFRKDAAILPDANNAENSFEGQVIFVGQGVSAPHLGQDDFKGLDLNGKIVLMVSGTLEKFPASEKAHFNSMATRAETAAKLGAVGVIAVITSDQGYKAWVDGVKGVRGIVNKDGTVSSGRVPTNRGLKFFAVGSNTFFKPIIEKLKKGDVVGTVKIKSSTTYSEIISYNVVGWIPGTDEKLKNEYVVHTAHLDHLGISTKIKGDSIYNGAHDNASGVSCALEIAKLYKSVKVKRSVIIAIVTAEEMGLLGSAFFASNPPVPKSQIVADINTDMPTLIAPMLSIEPLGAKHSSLMMPVTKAAKFLNLEIQEDHIPDQVRFVRSDQYSFIKEGIPALHIKYGLKTNDPTIDLKKKIDEWTKEHYHKPSDEFREEAFNFDGAITYVKLNFLIGYQVANAKKRPTWNKGDFFGKTFGR